MKNYLLYTTTHTDGSYYIGCYYGKPDDDYLGSGKALKDKLLSTDPEEWTKEIIETFTDKQEAYDAERLRIGSLWKDDSSCLNAHPGGKGGWDKVNAMIASGEIETHERDPSAMIDWNRNPDNLEQKQAHGKWLAENYGVKCIPKDRMVAGAKKARERDKLLGRNNGLKGKVYSEEEKDRIWPIIECPKCGTKGRVSAMKRWHGEYGEHCRK